MNHYIPHELERQQRLLAATQDEALRDEVWLMPPETTESQDD